MLIKLGFLFPLAVCPATWFDWDTCPGCVDDSPPVQQPYDGGYVPFDGPVFQLGQARLVVTVTNLDGGCHRAPFDPPYYGICQEAFPCTPHVEINLELVDVAMAASASWSVVAGGTVCNQGHPFGGASGSGSPTLTMFDDYVALDCGDSCDIDTNYVVTGTWRVGGHMYTKVTHTLNVDMDSALSCTICQL